MASTWCAFYSNGYCCCFFSLQGEYDALPEQAFYMVGPIEEVVQKAEKLAEEHA